MSDDASDRRRVERIRFAEPLPARAGDKAVSILDIGFLGARIRHEFPLEAGATIRLAFEYEGEPVEVECRVARSDFQPILSEVQGERVYVSGLEFVSSEGSAGATLKRLIGDHVVRALEAQKANAHAAVAELASDIPFLRDSGEGGRVRRVHAATYVCCRLGAGGAWKKTIISRPTQPADGFTIRLGETEEEIDRLCRAYADGSPEVRALIRLCAEMTALEDDQVLPPQNFTP